MGEVITSEREITVFYTVGVSLQKVKITWQTNKRSAPALVLWLCLDMHWSRRHFPEMILPGSCSGYNLDVSFLLHALAANMKTALVLVKDTENCTSKKVLVLLQRTLRYCDTEQIWILLIHFKCSCCCGPTATGFKPGWVLGQQSFVCVCVCDKKRSLLAVTPPTPLFPSPILSPISHCLLSPRLVSLL